MPHYLGAFADRKTIKVFLQDGRGLIAGMWVDTDQGPVLRDAGAEWPIPEAVWGTLPGRAPAWLALSVDGDACRVVYHQDIRVDGAMPGILAGHTRRRRRFEIHAAVRRFFQDRGFVDVDTPVAVPNPGSEPFLDTFPVNDLWLRTSPELHMKQLLGQGFESVFQMGPCFRKGDHGSLHREEFCMLEWYRCFADLDRIAQDITDLLRTLAPLADDPAYFLQAPERITCAELFARHLGLTLRDCEDRAPLREALASRGHGWEEEDDWDTLYFLLFLNYIEPHLGADRPVLVERFPASQAALAKAAPAEAGRMPTCYRMELYLKGGWELANGFYELTDPHEQRARFQADAARRKAMGKPVYAVDEDFLATLVRGLPPCAGIALGVDRLVGALLGASRLDEILPFSAH